MDIFYSEYKLTQLSLNLNVCYVYINCSCCLFLLVFEGPVQWVLWAPACLQQVSMASLQDQPRGRRLEQPQQRATRCQQVQIQSQQITLPDHASPAHCWKHSALELVRWNVALGFRIRLAFTFQWLKLLEKTWPWIMSVPNGNDIHQHSFHCCGINSGSPKTEFQMNLFQIIVI